MPKQIQLSNIHMGQSYVVVGFQPVNSAYAEKLHKMGFVEGTPVSLAQVQITDPMVVQIRGSRIALRKTEARQVLVREVSNA